MYTQKTTSYTLVSYTAGSTACHKSNGTWQGCKASKSWGFQEGMPSCYSCWYGSNLAGDWEPWCPWTDPEETCQGGQRQTNCSTPSLWAFNYRSTSCFGIRGDQEHPCGQFAFIATSFVWAIWLFYMAAQENLPEDWLHSWFTSSHVVLQWWSCLWQPTGSWHYKKTAACVHFLCWVWWACTIKRGIMACIILYEVLRGSEYKGWNESSDCKPFKTHFP